MSTLDLSIITPRGNSELILRVVDGKPVVVPPPAKPAPEPVPEITEIQL